MNAFVRAVPVDEPETFPEPGRQGIRKSAGLRPPQNLADQLVQERGRDLGLSRLGIHGHDRAGALAEIAQYVDRGIRHLTTPPVFVHLSEEGSLRAFGKLTGPPRLVEEDHREIGRSVGHDRLDQCAAAPRSTTVDARDFGEDRDLFAECHVRDQSARGPVDVATRVVLEHVDHTCDSHLLEARRDPWTDTLELGDRTLGQIAQREGRIGGRGYSTPSRNG